jgi:thiopeptide-type bacteriocin biosynthesis protein
MMALLLKKELKRLQDGNLVTLEELIPGFDQLWLRDAHDAPYFSEIVVPLLRRERFDTHTSVEPPAQTNARTSPSHVVKKQERIFFPGSSWNYVKLYCTPAQQDEIIAGPLSNFIGLLRAQQLIDRWFFLRYADPTPHLRLRIHASTNEHISRALNALLSFCQDLAIQEVIQRFSLDTYEREVARYGGPAAIDLLEEAMCLDSEICQKLIAAHYTYNLTFDPLATVCASLDRFFAVWGYSQEQRLKWLQKRSKHYAFHKEFHVERNLYSSLLTTRQEHINPGLLPQRQLLLTLIAPFERELAELATQVRECAQNGQLWVTEDKLLASLAHLHKVRLLDLDDNKEQRLYAYWRYTLESILKRSTTNRGSIGTHLQGPDLGVK